MKSLTDTIAPRVAAPEPGAGPLRRAADVALPVLKLGARRLAGAKSPFQMTLSLTNRCKVCSSWGAVWASRYPLRSTTCVGGLSRMATVNWLMLLLLKKKSSF